MFDVDSKALIRFWNNVAKKNIDECWNWIGTLNDSGYGKFCIKHQMKYADRVSYYLHYGSYDPKLFVCHKCDNPQCVNPNHLFLGTSKDNMQDAKNKCRTCIGSKNATSVLNESLVHNLIKDILIGKYNNLNQICKEYQLSETAIKNILNGNTWTHVTSKYDLKDIKSRIIKTRRTQKEIDELYQYIFEQLELGQTTVSLSKELGLNQSYISKIKNKQI